MQPVHLHTTYFSPLILHLHWSYILEYPRVVWRVWILSWLFLTATIPNNIHFQTRPSCLIKAPFTAPSHGLAVVWENCYSPREYLVSGVCNLTACFFLAWARKPKFCLKFHLEFTLVSFSLIKQPNDIGRNN